MSGPFHGSYVAMATPFRDGLIDFSALTTLVERQILAGTDGLVIAGTTGECSTLEPPEYSALVEFACGTVRRRVPVVVGVGTNATAESVRRIRLAERAGADGLLCVTPYYNRPGQRGFSAHFAKLAESTSLPIVLYNIPKRSGCDLEAKTALALSRDYENIIAIKETVCTKERFGALVGGGLDVLVGEDAFLVDGMHWGACGAISVVGNVRPQAVADLIRAASPDGDSARAADLLEELGPLMYALGLESNPTPLKHALATLGLTTSEVRLPLVEVTAETARVIEKLLQ